MRARPDRRTEQAARGAIERRDFRAAVAVLERGISRAGEDVVSLTMLAQCHEWLGEDARAVDFARRVLVESPAEPTNLRLVARCCLRIGEPATAYRCICRALGATRRERGAPAARWPALLARMPVIGRALRGSRHALRGDPGWVAWAIDWKASYEAHRRGETNAALH